MNDYMSVEDRREDERGRPGDSTGRPQSEQDIGPFEAISASASSEARKI